MSSSTPQESQHPVRRLLPSSRQGVTVAFSILLTVAIIGPGVVLLPGVESDHGGVAAADLNDTSFNQSAGLDTTESHSVAFKSDGSKMYTTGTSQDTVYQYSLSTPWDVSSRTLEESHDVSGQTPGPTGVVFGGNGSAMYVSDFSGDNIYKYALSDPYNVSTASLDQSLDISGNSVDPEDVYINDDDTKVYVATGANVTVYAMSEANNLSTAAYLRRFDASGQTSSVLDGSFNSDGRRFLVTGGTNDVIYEYEVSTPFDLSTASYHTSFDFTQDTHAEGARVGKSGSKLYIPGHDGSGNDAIYEYDTDIVATEPLSGQITDSNGDPVSNATVYAAGYDAANPPVIDGTPFDEHAKDPLPDGWDSQLEEPGIDRGEIDPSKPEWSETRVLLHTSDDWELRGPNMGRSIWEYVTMDDNEPRSEVVNPEVNLDRPRTSIAPEDSGVLTCWEFSDSASSLLDRPDPIDENIPGAETTSCKITIERVDPLGSTVGQARTRETNPFVRYDSRFYEVGVSDKTHEAVGWKPGQGVYKVYPKGKPENAMYYAVAPNGDVRTLESEIENWASSRAESISKYNKKVKEEYDAGNLEIVSGTTNETGHYTLDVPSQATEAELRVVKAGGVNSAPEGDLTRTDLRDEFDSTVRSNFRDATAVSFEEADEQTFVSVCQRMDPVAEDIGIPFYGQGSTDIPNQNADIQGRYLIPEDLDQRVRRCAALSYLDSIRDGFGDFLSPGLADDLTDLSTEDLRKLLRQVQSVIETNDVLCDAYASDLNVESCEDAITDPDDLTRGELENRVSDGYDTIDDSSDNLGGGGGGFLDGGGGGVDVGDGETDVDDEANEFSATFPVDGVSDWDSASLLVRLTWSDGSTTVLNESSEYVTVDDSLTGSDTVSVENYPIGDTDPAAVTARLDVVTQDSTGAGESGPVKNPTWNGDLPRLSSVKVSKWQPGTNDSFTVSVDPRDTARFGAFQRVEVTRPDGSTTIYDTVEDGEITARTGGAGLHRVAVVFTASDSENTEFTEVLQVDAAATQRDRPPSIRGQSGAIGRYAVVGHGLETGEITVERGGAVVTMTAVIPQDADVPQTLTADTRGLTVASDATTTVQLQRGDTRSTVRERIGIVLYADEIDDGALVWRNSDALTRAGTEWGQVTVENSTSIDTISDEAAKVQIRVNADPSPFDRVRHWVNANLPSLPLGSVMVDLTPIVALLVARRRRDPPEPPRPDTPGEHRQPNPQEA